MKESECYSGKRVGRLTLIEKRRIPSGRWTRGGWLCRCDCGTKKVFRTDGLGINKSRSTLSCGCYNEENNWNSKDNALHKKYEYSDSQARSKYHRIYKTWCHMKSRCENPNDGSYSDYGGRGIRVCDEWQRYALFKKWALKNGFDYRKSGLEQSIDRINVNGNYEPNNCRWADKYVQANNKRNNSYIEVYGVQYTFSELARKTGIDRLTLYARYRKGKRDGDLIAPINENMSHKRKDLTAA